MKTAPDSFFPALRYTRPAWAVLAGLVLCSPAWAAEPTTKPAPAPATPAPLRLNNPQERALLIDRINAALERTNQKYAQPRRASARRGKANDEPRYTIPTLAVELGAPPAPARPPRKRSAKRPLAAAAGAAAGAAVLAAPTAEAAVPELLPLAPASVASPTPTPAPAPTPAPTPTPTHVMPVVPVMPVEVVVPPPPPVQPPPTPLQEPEAASASRRYIAERAAELAAVQAVAPPAPVTAGNVVTTVPWSYAGATDPQAWGQLHPSFATCASGQRQSPIALVKPPEKSGPTASLPLGNQVFTGVLEHTGHFLELDVQGLSTLSLRGMEWELQRVQTRYPAEERIGPTEGVVMAVDLLYRAPTSQWAVVSVPLRLGAANPFLAQLWTHLPLHAGERVPLSPGELQLYDLLPAQRHYYQYLGSLTTPPCTEGVLRLVLKTPGTVAPEQLQRLMALLPPHARPPQPLYGRQVLVGP